MRPQPNSPQAIQSPVISVVVANGDPVASDIASILGRHADIDVIVACDNGKTAAASIQQFVPDIAVLDVGISDLNVFDVLSGIAANRLKTRVVFLVASPAKYDLAGLVGLGAQGILFKDADPDTIFDCVRNVYHGKRWLPAQVNAVLGDEMGRGRGSKPVIRVLTPRQREIALLVCDGLSNKQLGEQLNLTEGTVKVHLHKIYRKLGVQNRTALSTLAIANRASLRSRRGKRSDVIRQMT
jgi:two-component system, NarL family, nitrate/nitrite response regulator NarL